MPLPGLREKEAEAVREVRDDEIKAICRKWFEYMEYLTGEVDTDAMTCTVVPNR